MLSILTATVIMASLAVTNVFAASSVSGSIGGYPVSGSVVISSTSAQATTSFQSGLGEMFTTVTYIYMDLERKRLKYTLPIMDIATLLLQQLIRDIMEVSLFQLVEHTLYIGMDIAGRNLHTFIPRYKFAIQAGIKLFPLVLQITIFLIGGK